VRQLKQIWRGLIAMTLAIATLQAVAAEQLGGRDFNHMTTGFPLSGVHATAACETCHVGGVLKGTPRNCDGCHALGQRVVATPKSTSHIVTDAPCENCHFNTATFLGARYNHGAAMPGQCRTCHNGLQATGKPGSHNTGSKATASCDQCHRSVAWGPASWNHIGVAPGTCTTCHNGSTAIGKPAGHNTVAKATFQCDECHSFIGWLPARYKHTTAGVCSSCHDGATAIGKPASHSPAAIKGINPCNDCHKVTTSWLPATYTHSAIGSCVTCHDGVKAVGKNAGHIATTDDCNSCHTSTLTWAGALGAKPANHIPYTAGVTCSSCHIGTTVVKGVALHNYVSSYACTTCHLKGNGLLGNMDTKSIGHEGMKAGDDCSRSGCHKPLGNRGSLYTNWD
jgi:hypothetical protein